MAYDIPQELEYKEKFLLGLTLSQVIILISYVAIGFLLYRHWKFNVYSLVIIETILISLCLSTLFLDLPNKIKAIYKYFSQKLISFGLAMNSYIGVKEIKENKIITNDKKISVLKISSLNFSIKEKDEKNSIIESFRRFLNSIDFPIQILINTHKIKLKSYLEILKNKPNSDNLISHLISNIKKFNVLDRSFYILIPETSDLDIQIKLCQDSLNSLGLKSTLLNDQELKDLLAKHFEGDFDGSLESYIYPDKIESKSNYIKINEGDKEIYSRVVCATGYPRTVEAGFLDKIISTIGNFDISLHITPFPIETMLLNVNKQLQKQLADLYSSKAKGQISPMLDLRAKDTRLTLEDLQKGKDKLFSISFYINCRTKTYEELEYISKKVESLMNSIMIIPKVKQYRQLDALKSVSPLCDDRLKITRTLPTNALSAFFPFTSPFFKLDKEGIWFGNNKNNIPIIRDIFSLSNPNGVILAQSGGGKSFLAKLLISRHLINGTKVIVIDPQGEYTSLIQSMNGQVITLAKDSDTMLNPLDLMGHEYGDKRLFLMDLWNIMFKDLSDTQKSMLDKAVTYSYERHAINENIKTWNRIPPTMKYILNELKRMEESATAHDKISIHSLINRVSMYVEGAFSFLSCQSKVDLKKDFVSFDISRLPNQVKPVMMFLVLDFIYMQMRKSSGNKVLVIDEAWSLLNRTQDANYIMEIVKTCRKFGLGLLLLNQEVDGLLNSKAGKSVLANTSYTVLLRQKPAVIKEVVKTFNLSPTEKDLLLSSSVGEGLLIMEDERNELKVHASSKEYEIISTKPKEVEYVKAKENIVVKPMDLDELFYDSEKLDKGQVAFLKSKGYVLKQFKDFKGNSRKWYFKGLRSESPSHIFMVEIIREYFADKNVMLQLYATVKPDVVILLNNGRSIAFEVETGNMLKYKPKEFKQKIEYLKENYDDFFIVVPDRNLVSSYQKYGKVLTKRNFTRQMRNHIYQ